MYAPLSQRAVGRWPGILAAIGVPSKALRNVHGPCPLPGCPDHGGKDRFRFDDKNGHGTWICSQCGYGRGADMAMRFLGVDFKDAAKIIEQHLPNAPVVLPDRPQPNDLAVRQEMIDLWEKRCRPITSDDAAGRYLIKRLGNIQLPQPSCLRLAPDEKYFRDGARPLWFPAMVALVEPSDEAKAAGEKAALHRTFLDRHGAAKADVAPPRKMMPGRIPAGAAVRLFLNHGKILGIAEGIETALAASVLYNTPTWSALNSALLEKWTPPASVETVLIFADNDRNGAGQQAAARLEQRLRASGFSAFVETSSSRSSIVT